MPVRFARAAWFGPAGSVLLACLSLAAPAQRPLASIAADFGIGFVEVDGQRYPYRLLQPLARHRATPRPLVVFLHGAGERGDDNLSQLRWLPEQLALPESRERWPCYLLALQCPSAERWVDASWHDVHGPTMAARPTRALTAVERALRRIALLPGVDAGRVYVTGLSMGGFGCWELAARQPDCFAAALPVCGGGDPATARLLLGLPIEVWHGGRDEVVPVERSREMVAALLAFGVTVRYREVADCGHDVWRRAYGEGGALAWLFAQDQRQQPRGLAAGPAIVPRPDRITRGVGSFRLAAGARLVVPEQARRLAAYLLDELELELRRRPGLVARATPAAGDVVFAIDDRLDIDFELEIGQLVTLTARDEPALRRGAAALHQALHTWPDLVVPACRVVQRQPPASGRLQLGASEVPWSARALALLLRECWLASVDSIAFVGSAEPPAAADAWREFVERGALLGIAIGCGPAGESNAAFVVDDSAAVADVLARSLAPGADRVPFVLRVAAAPPDGMVAAVRRLLPAVAERANRPNRPIHVGGYLARYAARWR